MVMMLLISRAEVLGDQKMEKSRVNRFFLALYLTAFVLLSASADDPAATVPSVAGKPKESIVFSMLYNDKDSAPLRKDWLILTEIAKRKNITFKITTGPDSNYMPSVDAAINSADVPDIILKVWPAAIAPFAATGQLLPINDYEYLLPNYMNYQKTGGLRDKIDALRDKNGNYYILPGFQREIQVQQWIYRQDLFEAYKIREPRTYDELYSALLILKGIYPNSRPLTACYGGAHLFAMMGAGNGIASGWNGNRMYDEPSDSWVFAPRTKNWREMYRFLHKCYAAGLLDPDVFTQDPDTFLKKLTNGTSFVTVTWISSGFSLWNKQLGDSGIKSGFWAPMEVPQSTTGIRALPAVDRFRKGTAITVNAVAKPYFKELMAFLDWIYYTEEGRTLAVWGMEGTTYEVKNGKKAYTQIIKTWKNPLGTLDPARDFGLNTMFDLCEVPDFEDSKKPAEIVAFLNDSLSKKLTSKPYPPLTLGSAEQATINIIAQGLDEYVASMVKKFITGEADIDQDWNSYLATLRKLGSDSLEGIWNKAWKNQK